MPRPPRWSRRPRRAEPGKAEPEPVSISRVTVIGATGFDDETAASSWLERCRRREAERDEIVEEALLVVNRALHGHRLADADPYGRDVSPGQAVAVRLGYGSGDEVVEGHWKEAYALPPSTKSRAPRRQMLAPQEELAGILSGRRAVHVSEDLILRARLDLDQGRSKQAALQLRAGLDALAAEQSGAESASGVDSQAATARKIAAAALAGELSEDQLSALRETLEQVERVLRRRRHRGEPSAG